MTSIILMQKESTFFQIISNFDNYYSERTTPFAVAIRSSWLMIPSIEKHILEDSSIHIIVLLRLGSVDTYNLPGQSFTVMSDTIIPSVETDSAVELLIGKYLKIII